MIDRRIQYGCGYQSSISNFQNPIITLRPWVNPYRVYPFFYSFFLKLHICVQLFSDFSLLEEEHSSYHLKRRRDEYIINKVLVYSLFKIQQLHHSGSNGFTKLLGSFIALSAYNWMGVGLHGTTHQFGPITNTVTAVWKQSIT